MVDTAKQRRKKINLPALLYLIAGGSLFILLMLTINSYLLNLKIETAVVNDAIELITTPVSGYLAEIFVNTDSTVKKADPLFKIENMEFEKEWQLARMQAKDAEITVNYLQQLLQDEEERLQLYGDIGANRIAFTKAQVAIAEREHTLAEKNLARMNQLHTKHYLSEINWDQANIQYKETHEKVQSALAQMNVEQNSLKALQKGLYFTGNKLEGKQKDLTAELISARKHLAISIEKVKIYENLGKKLLIKAPYNGKIIQVLKSVGNSVDTNKGILLLEKSDENKHILAYLTQNEILYLRLNSKVKVYIPSLNRIFNGRVAVVNRTAGFIDEMNAQYRWRDLYSDRSGIATIEIAANEQEKFNHYVKAGMPAIVYFPRKFF